MMYYGVEILLEIGIRLLLYCKKVLVLQVCIMTNIISLRNWPHLYIFLTAAFFKTWSSVHLPGHVRSLMRLYDVYDSLCDMLYVYVLLRYVYMHTISWKTQKRWRKIWWMKEREKRNIHKCLHYSKIRKKQGMMYENHKHWKNKRFEQDCQFVKSNFSLLYFV